MPMQVGMETGQPTSGAKTWSAGSSGAPSQRARPRLVLALSLVVLLVMQAGVAWLSLTRIRHLESETQQLRAALTVNDLSSRLSTLESRVRHLSEQLDSHVVDDGISASRMTDAIAKVNRDLQALAASVSVSGFGNSDLESRVQRLEACMDSLNIALSFGGAWYGC